MMMATSSLVSASSSACPASFSNMSFSVMYLGSWQNVAVRPVLPSEARTTIDQVINAATQSPALTYAQVAPKAHSSSKVQIAHLSQEERRSHRSAEEREDRIQETGYERPRNIPTAPQSQEQAKCIRTQTSGCRLRITSK